MTIQDGIRDRVIRVMKDTIASDPAISNRKLFAQAIGTTSSAISKWEAGTAYPTIENIVTICKTFGIDADFILTGRTRHQDTKELKRLIKQLLKEL